MPQTTRRMRFPLALIAALTPVAAAQHVDVQVQVVGNRLNTGRINFTVPPPFPIESDIRVYRAAFGEFPNFTDDPGFNASAATVPQGTLLGFNILDAFRKWDGTDFDAIPAERLTISLSGTTRQTPLVADQFVAGFNFLAADAQGGFHQHINYFLNTPQTQGVYALKLEIVSPGSGIQPSLPFWVVFRQGNTTALMQQQDAAIAFLQAQLQPPACPGDVDGDRMVGLSDLAVMIQNWTLTVPPGTSGDLDTDGVVGLADIAIAIQNWDTTCP